MHDLARWSSLSSRFLIELSVCSVLFSSVSDNLQIFFICFTTKGSVMITNCCFLSFRDEAFSGNDSLNINLLWYCWLPFPYYAQDVPLSIHPSSTFQRSFVSFWYNHCRQLIQILGLWACDPSWCVWHSPLEQLLKKTLALHLTHILFGLV